jgi:hypothetical protein
MPKRKSIISWSAWSRSRSRYWAPNAKQVANMQRGPSRQQNRRLLVFSELPSLPSAGRQPTGLFPYFPGFSTSLGSEPRSLIRVSLGWFNYTKKNVRKGNPTPACSPVSDRRRLTAFVEVNWARRVQAPMPQISGPNLQENQVIETFKEDQHGRFIIKNAWLLSLTGTWTSSPK